MIVADEVTDLTDQVFNLCIVALSRAIPSLRTQGGLPLAVDEIYVVALKPHLKEKVLGLGVAVDASLNKDLESEFLTHSFGNFLGDLQIGIQGRAGYDQVALEFSTLRRIVCDSLGKVLALDELIHELEVLLLLLLGGVSIFERFVDV